MNPSINIMIFRQQSTADSWYEAQGFQPVDEQQPLVIRTFRKKRTGKLAIEISLDGDPRRATVFLKENAYDVSSSRAAG